MDKSDLFIKVSNTAYFEANNLNIKQKIDKKNDNAPVLYIDDRSVYPSICFFYEDTGEVVKKLNLDFESVENPKIVTREDIEKEEPSFKIFNEILEKAENSKVKRLRPD